MQHKISRRNAITTGLKATAAGLIGFGYDRGEQHLPKTDNKVSKPDLPFRVSLNTSTLMTYKLPVVEQIKMVGKAGFDGIELWMRDITAYVEKGGSLASLKQKLESHDLVLENIIAFSKWCSDDATERKEALELMRSEMKMIAELGGQFFAAPVQGIEKLNPNKYGEYAQRYADALKIGDEVGVVPLIELWGMGALHKVSDCAKIVVDSGHPKAAMLLDFYHVHRGGNDWDTIHTLNAGRFPVVHMNDYPASPPAESLTDADRVLPGEGVCPFDEILPKLYDAGFRGGLSVELFNKGYWESMDAKTLLKKSYNSTRLTIERAMENFK